MTIRSWHQLNLVEQIVLRHMPDEWTISTDLPPLTMSTASVAAVQSLIAKHLIEFKPQGSQFDYRRTLAGKALFDRAVSKGHTQPAPRIVTDQEVTQLMVRIQTDAPEAIPAAPRSKSSAIVGSLKLLHEPTNGDEFLTLAYDAASLALQYVGKTLATVVDDDLRQQLLEVRKHMNSIIGMIDHYDNEEQARG